MNQKKLLLAHIRNGDYAHAGEEEAIELAMLAIPKSTNQFLLDIGCGLGGTANYLNINGWGDVTAIDNNHEVIDYARNKYPNISFNHCDVLNIKNAFNNKKFDIVYSFNAFFCFQFQKASLQAMNLVSKKNAILIIFDYTSHLPNVNINPFDNQSSYKNQFFPINLSIFSETLLETGWRLEHNIDLTEKFQHWYQNIIEKMNYHEMELVHSFGQNTFSEIHTSYTKLLELIKKGIISGSVIRARKK